MILKELIKNYTYDLVICFIDYNTLLFWYVV
jgi:hypothetical protein